MDPLKTKTFQKRVEFLKESQFWPKEKLEEYQLKQLQSLVKYVSENIPFYSRFLKEKNLTWKSFKQINDIKKFPIITKKDIQKDYSQFLPLGINKDNLLYRTTGGSTGTPLTIYMDLDHLSKDKANTEHYMEAIGLNIFDYKSIRLYGDKVPEDLLSKKQYWYLKEGRKLVMSCYYINEQTVLDYIKKINELKPKYIHTRPSAILPLARYMFVHKIKLEESIKDIICDGESLNITQRDMIEEAFGTRVTNVYGHTEGCVVAHCCKKSRLLHFMPQVGIVELLDKKGDEVMKEGEKGEIIVTGFNNLIMPLIRYRTGDIAVHTNKKCSCGRNYRMAEAIEGRMQDYVIDRKNNILPLSPALFNYNDMDWKGVRDWKAFQEEPGKLLLKIVREENNKESEKDMQKRIKEKIEQIFGKTFEINIEFVDELSRTKIGKFRYLDQKLDTSKYFQNV